MNTVQSAPSRPLQYLKAIAGSGLPTGTRATCWAIASFADNVSGKAWPTVATLAKATGLTEPTVSRHTKLAEAAGYLHKHIRRNNSILYTITVPVTDDMIMNLDPEPSSEEQAPREGYSRADEQNSSLGQ